ncbi:hypothetical protein A9R05_40880 (plasmid) [Burkholderia sp. KK1]|nr:hypothetical protein A9R05_40880 [Burkholderia sp. KK1]
MSYEPPLLSEFIAAGDEINLALLEINSKDFAADGDRKTARRAVLADAVAKHDLPGVREAVLSHEISGLVANRPMMNRLFDYHELKAMCLLRATPSLVDRYVAVKRENPLFGLGEIMALAVEASEHHQWGQLWEE